MRKSTILLLSAGSRSIEAILDCLQPLRDQLICVGTNSIPEFVSLKELDAAYIFPETSQQDAYMQRLSQLIANIQPDLIINGRDEEVPLIIHLLQGNALECTYPALAMADCYTDKYLTYQFCQEHGLPFVKTAVFEEEVQTLLEMYGLPIVAKPRYNGHASKNVFVLFEEAEVISLLAEGSYIFQPFVGPSALREAYRSIKTQKGVPLLWNPSNFYYNIDFLFDKNGTEVNRCITRAHRSGSIIKEMWISDDPLMHKFADSYSEVLTKSGHRGPLNIQGYLNGDSYDVFEWNARFVGSTYGFALLGKNLVLDWLKCTLPHLRIPAIPMKQAGKVFRPMSYQFVTQEPIDTLKNTGEWRLNC